MMIVRVLLFVNDVNRHFDLVSLKWNSWVSLLKQELRAPLIMPTNVHSANSVSFEENFFYFLFVSMTADWCRVTYAKHVYLGPGFNPYHHLTENNVIKGLIWADNLQLWLLFKQKVVVPSILFSLDFCWIWYESFCVSLLQGCVSTHFLWGQMVPPGSSKTFGFIDCKAEIARTLLFV